LFNRIRTKFDEKYTNVWVLLSDTDRFVSRAGLMPHFEWQLRQWRASLQSSRGNSEIARKIRSEIVDFRRCRRLEGWELRLGSLDIQLKGFRKDDAMAVGFRRMVLMVGEKGHVQYITGSGNHIQLDEEINARFRKRAPAEPMEPHYLWYRRAEGVLELAGADSQSSESQKRLSKYIQNHKSDLVRALYKLT